MSFQAEARIVCRLFGSMNDVTIGGRKAPIRRHPSFNAMSITQRLFNVPSVAVDTVPDDDRAVCLAKATAYVSAELPAGYTVGASGAFPVPGHAMIHGQWVPINPAYVSYAFPLLRNNEQIEDECLCEDAAGNEQSLMLSWWVVIQPR